MYLSAFDVLLGQLKKKGVECTILSVDYSLAPKARFPQPINEVVAAYEYLLKDLSIPPKQIFVGGDSAGGGLTLALAYQIRESLPPPAGLILISPWTDTRNNERHLQSPFLKYDMLTEKLLTKATKSYLQGQPQSHLSSPVLGDTAGFPPCLVAYGKKEIFRGDIFVFIEKLKKENGEEKVRVVSHPDGIHDYPLYPEYFGKKSFQALESFADFIKGD